MQVITNNSDISLTLAVWLLNDEYDYIDEPNYVSVTRLMKPLRHIILPRRVPQEKRMTDVADFIATGVGKSLHDSVEKAWLKSYVSGLQKLGYPQHVIDRVLINPEDEQVLAAKEPIPIYLEQRAFRTIKVGGIEYRIGGKFDMVAEGHVEDVKSTTAYSWIIGGTKTEGFKLQMSLYRWLDAVRSLRRITEDFGRINFIFTDWAKRDARSNPKYPQKRVEHIDMPLLSLEETGRYVEMKLAAIQKYWDAPEKDIPECTDEELWRSAPSYKFFSNPANTAGRSTKNFDNLAEANIFMAEKGKGIVITVPSEPKRCGFCDAYDVCTQKDRYFD